MTFWQFERNDTINTFDALLKLKLVQSVDLKTKLPLWSPKCQFLAKFDLAGKLGKVSCSAEIPE